MTGFNYIPGSDLTLNRDALTIVRKFRATDTIPTTVGGDYFDYIGSLAMAWITQYAPTYNSPYGTLYWNNIQVHENHYAQNYEIGVTYGPHDNKAGAYQITVDQTGGTVHVTAGTRIAGYGTDVVDNGGLIGVVDGEPQGTDISVEQVKLTVTYRHPRAFLNDSYIRAVGKLVGFPNNDTFLSYSPGEVVYLGGNFTQTDTESSASYSFAVSYNRTSFDVGGITITEKKGWDVISPVYKTTTDNDRKVKQLLCIEIVRPAGRDWQNYVSVFGWG